MHSPARSAAARRATQSRARAAPRTAARRPVAERIVVERRPAATRTEARRPAVMHSSEPSAGARRRAVAAPPPAVRISARLPSVRFLQADRSLAAHRVAETAAHLEAAGAAVAASAVAQRCWI